MYLSCLPNMQLKYASPKQIFYKVWQSCKGRLHILPWEKLDTWARWVFVSCQANKVKNSLVLVHPKLGLYWWFSSSDLFHLLDFEIQTVLNFRYKRHEDCFRPVVTWLNSMQPTWCAEQFCSQWTAEKDTFIVTVQAQWNIVWSKPVNAIRVQVDDRYKTRKQIKTYSGAKMFIKMSVEVKDKIRNTLRKNNENLRDLKVIRLWGFLHTAVYWTGVVR